VAERTAQLSAANTRLGKNYLSSIKAFSNLIELRGGLMAGHSRRVAELARRIAVEMNLPAADTQDIFVAGLLHDIGQVGLSDAVLACPVPRMTPEDKARYIKHPTLGEQALLALDDMHRVAMIVRSHHERHDGQGFPEGLSGDAIPVGARILALAETFEDLQSGHVSRGALAHDDARVLIERGRGTQFEATVVDAFLESIRVPEPALSLVELTVDKLEPGMRLARDLRSREGVVLLAADHVLNADLIRRISAHAARHNLSLLIPVRTDRRAGNS
jgi:response regulator RpfG family c-di-GMP phosphodiesterase